MGQGGESDDDGSLRGEGPPGRDPSSASIRIDSTPSQHARAVGAWRSWLEALASDAEAALAAAMTYAALPPEGRDAWLDALERDRGLVDVPHIALYAPLVAVEPEEQRRARIVHAMGALPGACAGKALRGAIACGDRVCAVATPLYLDFVELLVCRYNPERGVFSAYHDPFRSFRNEVHVSSLVASTLDEAVTLSPAPLRVVIEELAHAVVADRREGRAPPEALARFSHLFGPDLEKGLDATDASDARDVSGEEAPSA